MPDPKILGVIVSEISAFIRTYGHDQIDSSSHADQEYTDSASDPDQEYIYQRTDRRTWLDRLP